MPQDPAETPKEMPGWFDQALHAETAYGIVRRRDHALLAADGFPASDALRAAEAEERDARRKGSRRAPAATPEGDA